MALIQMLSEYIKYLVEIIFLTREPPDVIPFYFDSFIYHSIEYIEVKKSLKEFLPMALPSEVRVVLLNYQAIQMYLPSKQKYEVLPSNFAHS